MTDETKYNSNTIQLLSICVICSSISFCHLIRVTLFGMFWLPFIRIKMVAHPNQIWMEERCILAYKILRRWFSHELRPTVVMSGLGNFCSNRTRKTFHQDTNVAKLCLKIQFVTNQCQMLNKKAGNGKSHLWKAALQDKLDNHMVKIPLKFVLMYLPQSLKNFNMIIWTHRSYQSFCRSIYKHITLSTVQQPLTFWTS